jgi:hypothetical protein
MNRRQFAFWLGFGLFSLSEKFHLGSLDRLAAATMRAAARNSRVRSATDSTPHISVEAVHWTLTGNDTWRWYERENLINGTWRSTGVTTPINKKTGERTWEPGGFLDESLLPAEMRAAEEAYKAGAVTDDASSSHDDHHNEPNPHLPTDKVRSRHGRPPSKWLRSLYAYELSTWLKTVDVPEAGVSGMTVWTHLTRDHHFDAAHILGLTVAEQDKLHAAAHFGY